LDSIRIKFQTDLFDLDYESMENSFVVKWSTRGLGKEDVWSQVPNLELNQNKKRQEFEDWKQSQSVVFLTMYDFWAVRSGIEEKGRNSINIKKE